MNRKIGVFLSYILMIFEVLSTLLLTPFIIRTLGQAEFGVYKLCASITAYLLLLDLGVGNSVTRYISKFRATNDADKESQFFGVATVYYAIIAVIALICGALLVEAFPSAFAKGLSPSEIALGQKLLGITMVNAAVTLGTSAFNNIIIAYERFDVSKGASIVQVIVRIILTYLAVRIGFGSIGIVTVNLVMTIISRTFFVCYVFLGLKLFPKFRGIQWGFVREIIVYSSLILMQMIATQINSNIDQLLIGSLVVSSSEILAVYSIGSQIVQYFQSIGSAFNGILMPGIVKMVETDVGRSGGEMLRIGRIIFSVLAIIWGVFLVFGSQFIELWAGNINSEAYYVAVILMTAFLFILTESVGTQILWALNIHKEQAILKLVIVLVNIAVTVVLIMWNPLIGATIGTFISLMLGDVFVMNYVFVKKLKLKIKNYYFGLFKGIAPCLIMAVTVGVIIKVMLPFAGWIGLMIHILIMVTVYGITMMLFGFNCYEKQLIRSLFKRF